MRSAISARRSADERRQLVGRLGAVTGVTPAGDARGGVERDVEPAEVDEQAQVLDVVRVVVAVVVVASRRARQPAGALVESDRVGRDADLSGEFADAHRVITSVRETRPWSYSDVNEAGDVRRYREGP